MYMFKNRKIKHIHIIYRTMALPTMTDSFFTGFQNMNSMDSRTSCGDSWEAVGNGKEAQQSSSCSPFSFASFAGNHKVMWVKSKMNHPFGNGLYNLFRVIWGMVYCCFTYITWLVYVRPSHNNPCNDCIMGCKYLVMN